MNFFKYLIVEGLRIRLNIIAMVLSFAVMGCNAYKPLGNLVGQTVIGKVFDGDSGEAMIGLSIVEYGNYRNGILTDTTGRFELVFEQENPILIIPGFEEPIYVLIHPDRINTIYINKRLEKCSEKLHAKVKKYERLQRSSKFENE